MSKYRRPPQIPFNLSGELIIDNFAGGGGASTGIEAAIGRAVDIAINHDANAVAMHTVNHPHTRHYCENVWDVDPAKVCGDNAVGLAWFSPDCKHFSKAKGKTPVKKEIRGLAWVVLRWIAKVRPRVIILENVEEFQTWGPLVRDDDGHHYPCPKRKGQTFRSFINAIRRHGYKVEWKELRASDYGAPTIRKRLFLIARRDGQPITWPKPTHGDPKSAEVKRRQLKPWRTAAEIIDWSIPCPSIFERKRPLAENTMRRIARGIQRFVIDSPDPFIVRIAQTGFGGDRMQYSIDDPLTTVTSKAEHCLVAPFMIPRYGERPGQDPRCSTVDAPLNTVVATNNQGQLCAAFLAKHFGGMTGVDLRTPLPTTTMKGCQNQLVTSHLLKLRRNSYVQDVRTPLDTVTGGGTHFGEVRAFLMKYYSEGGQWQSLKEPMHTIPTRDRIGLVMVHGEPYQIVDIGMRMLQPHELYAAQGFPADYIFHRDAAGRRFTKTVQVSMCGNSVCPPIAEAIVRSNLVDADERAAA